MLTFFSGCAGLFSATFNAACSLDYFQFVAAFLLMEVAFGMFFMFYHGIKKM